MATRAELILFENNDETLLVTITSADSGEDLTAITALELFLKISPKYTDADPTTVVLTSADPGEIDIISQTADEIVAEAFIPGTDLTAPYDRFWHLDGINATGRRTALYGKVDVVNL